MMTTWELWDLASGNLVGGFDTEAEALAEIRAMIAAYGPDDMQGYGLQCVELIDADHVEYRGVATGAALVTRALED